MNGRFNFQRVKSRSDNNRKYAYDFLISTGNFRKGLPIVSYFCLMSFVPPRRFLVYCLIPLSSFGVFQMLTMCVWQINYTFANNAIFGQSLTVNKKNSKYFPIKISKYMQ